MLYDICMRSIERIEVESENSIEAVIDALWPVTVWPKDKWEEIDKNWPKNFPPLPKPEKVGRR